MNTRIKNFLLFSLLLAITTRSVGSGGIDGGGISIGGYGSAQILDNVISNNTMYAVNGGGITLFAAGTPVIKGNIITDNTASASISYPSIINLILHTK